jgi:carboxypeptidase PM20D1
MARVSRVHVLVDPLSAIMIKRLLLILLALLLLLVSIITVNTLRKGSLQIQTPPAPRLTIDQKSLSEKLGGAVRLRTVAAFDNADASADEFLKMHAYLEQQFPRVHAALKREVVGKYSLLYTWPGSDAAAKPVMFMAHTDVVAVAPGTEANWQSPPFSGEVKSDYVWGRGAWDNKSNLITQLEAVEMLLASGFKPRQTVYLAFGHDEEVSGLRGSLEIMKLLQSRNVRLDFVLDEGLLVTDGIIPGLRSPAALVGTAEKGFISLTMKTTATPGHPSLPPPKGTTAISMMSTALKRLDDDQLPAGVRGVAKEMFETLAPEMGLAQRVVFSNLWLFAPIVQPQLEKGAGTNAFIRTTTAFTTMQAGDRGTIIPGEASATVSFHILPGDTRDGVMAHVKARAGEKFEFKTRPGSDEPTPISPTSSTGYRQIHRTLRAVFPEAIVAPGLMVARSDSRHFIPIADDVYRFSPIRAKPDELDRFHGTNERIAVSNLVEMVNFYHRLIENLNAPAP